MKDPKYASLRVTRQGVPLLCNEERAFVIADGGDVVCLDIDLHSKWCRVVSTSSCSDGSIGVDVAPTEDTVSATGITRDGAEGETSFEFPDHKGWEIYTAVCHRYTVRVVLVRWRTKGED